MGKKRMAVLGGAEEAELRTKATVKREQKKLRTGKSAKAPGLAGGQRVVDTAEESLRELEVIEAKKQMVAEEEKKPTAKPAKVRSKNYLLAKTQVDAQQKYSLADAIKLLRSISFSKANATVELHITLKEKGWIKEVELPHPTGKLRRIAIADAATLADVAAGKINFDVLLASPTQMPQLVPFAKLLGPKDLMPNPKARTVVDNPQSVAKKMAAANTISLTTEKDAPIIHTVVGKLAMTDSQLVENISTLLTSLSPSHISKVVLKSTMSPAIKLVVP